MLEGLKSESRRALIAGTVASVVWILLLVLLRALGGNQGGWLSVLTGLLPLPLIWLAVGMVREIGALRDEADTLRMQLAAMRGSGAGWNAPVSGVVPVSENTAPAQPVAPRPAPRDDRQVPLDLPEPAPLPAIDDDTLIRALNFPDGPDDQGAIDALREALRHPEQARLIRAAQDVITLLADQGLYMDDLAPALAPATAVRGFAAGERGAAVAGLGHYDSPELIALLAEFLRRDEVLRDTVQHFLRRFDRMLTEKAPGLDDHQLLVLMDTRTGRGFLLFARVTGMLG